MDQETFTTKAILDEIGSRTSRNPILSSSLEVNFGVSGVRVREIVSQEGRRARKMLIVSGPKGYYIARDYREYCDAMHHYLARAQSIMTTEKILREYYMPHEGQQKLFQGCG